MTSCFAASQIPATEAALRSAAQAGGDYSVTNAGNISLSQPIQIQADLRVTALFTVTLSGSNATRIFEIGPGRHLELQNFDLANGAAISGGAINNNGFFTATACIFRNNTATGTGGLNGSSGQDAMGGAVFSSGGVWLWSCRFTSNLVVGGTGSAPPGTSQSQYCGNGGHGSGGAVTSLGSLIASNCVFFANRASGGAGGSRGVGVPGSSTNEPIYGGAGGAGIGGALRISGTCSVQSTLFSNNTAVGGAGGLYGGDGGAAGGGAVTVLTGTSVLSQVRFEANQAVGTAGQPGFTKTIAGGSNPPVNGGSGGESTGSAVYVDDGKTTVDRCFIVRNVLIGGDGASGGGNSTANGSGGPGGRGGGINGTVCNIGQMVLTACTFFQNVLRGGNAGAGGSGSAAGGRGGDSPLTAGSGGNGGSAGAAAIWIDMANQDATVESCTLAGNRSVAGNGGSGGSPPRGASGIAGGFWGANIGSMGMAKTRNTIMASAGSGGQIVGGSTDLGGNLCSDGSCQFTQHTSLNNVDPLLLPLVDNGGPTMTMALRVGSPALNAADCASSPATDQRGYVRPEGSGCDIGAYEGPGAPQLQISRVTVSTNRLRWLAEATRKYRVEQSSNWNGWTPMTTNTEGSNGILDLQVPAGASPRFYRLNVQ